MTLLVTGGRNYIGRIVTEELPRAGHEVIAVADFAGLQPAAVPPRVTCVRGHLADQRTIALLLTQYRGIQAGLPVPGEAADDLLEALGGRR